MADSFYLVASFKPYALGVPPGDPAYEPIPAAIRLANVICVIEAQSEHAAITLLADWDEQPPSTPYFAIKISPEVPAAVVLTAEQARAEP